MTELLHAAPYVAFYSILWWYTGLMLELLDLGDTRQPWPI